MNLFSFNATNKEITSTHTVYYDFLQVRSITAAGPGDRAAIEITTPISQYLFSFSLFCLNLIFDFFPFFSTYGRIFIVMLRKLGIIQKNTFCQYPRIIFAHNNYFAMESKKLKYFSELLPVRNLLQKSVSANTVTVSWDAPEIEDYDFHYHIHINTTGVCNILLD